MKNALIDVGSNTIRLVVYDGFKEIENYADHAGLIADVSDGEISPVGIAKIVRSLGEMKKKANALGADNIYAFATASLRDITDKEGLVCLVKAATGIEIEIISGDKEAYYDYLGLKMINNLTEGIAFDLGGGSCQLLAFAEENIRGFVSLPLGGLKLHRDFVKGNIPDSYEMSEISAFARNKISDFTPFENCGFEKLYAMGGSVFTLYNLAKEYFGSEAELTAETLKKICTLSEDRIYAVAPKRLRSVIPAALVMIELLEFSGAKEIVISVAGVRDGVLYSRFSDAK